MGMDAPPAGSSGGGDDSLLGALLSSIDFSEPMSFDGEEKTEYDPLRDGPLRYLGYANELGEAFAAWLFPGGVPLRWAGLTSRGGLASRAGLGSGQAAAPAAAPTRCSLGMWLRELLAWQCLSASPCIHASPSAAWLVLL